MAIQFQPTRIPEPFADSGSKNGIPATNDTPSASQAASWASGFPPECSQPLSAGGCPVPRNDFNGILNQLSQDYAFRQDGGIWSWSAVADYDTQRLVLGSDGKIYWSLAQSGPGTGTGAVDPSTDDGTHWGAVSMDISGFSQGFAPDAAYVLPVANGGTGSSTQNFVDLSSDQVISGRKVFSSQVVLSKENRIRNSEYILDTELSEDSLAEIVFQDRNQWFMGGIYEVAESGSSKPTSCFIQTLLVEPPTPANQYSRPLARIGVTKNADSSGYAWIYNVDGFYPKNANTTLGLNNDTNRWGQIYSSQTTISTSDERVKNSVSQIPDEVLDAWGALDWVQFKYNEAVASKGDAARLHTGLIAQTASRIFEDAGLDASKYGFFCHDEWEAVPAKRDVDGSVLDGMDAGDLYSVRYVEALCMEAAYQRRRADRAEARLAALEERLAAIESKLNAQP